ncbi:OLC1v1031176C1 [Oldenlandia corymbosa var. corymbosa]|uniref:OLC1v1031176C1 n=1 Tax=Oldenlandia corymbosa var. corymbosa TaxID=529605 RepID=A0AAV1CIC8_OLDCO|nr:OLC1v1031176C1 [Oldenlandia corymbosa var. corymbosa]
MAFGEQGIPVDQQMEPLTAAQEIPKITQNPPSPQLMLPPSAIDAQLPSPGQVPSQNSKTDLSQSKDENSENQIGKNIREISPSVTQSPSSSNAGKSPQNSSISNGTQKLNSDAAEFSYIPQPQAPILEVLLPITDPKLYLSKDDMEVGNNIETFNLSYSIEEIYSEGRINHTSIDSDDEHFDMEYAMEPEFFYSEISVPTYHNRSKKAKA